MQSRMGSSIQSSEDTDSHDIPNTQTDNSFVTEQTDPDPNSESWHPDTGTEADTTTDTVPSDWMATIVTFDTSKYTPPSTAPPSPQPTQDISPHPGIMHDHQLTEGIETEDAGNGLSMLQIFRHGESHVMMNMLAGNTRSRPIEFLEQLQRTDEMPTHQQYGAVWKQLTDMGHDEELAGVALVLITLMMYNFLSYRMPWAALV